MAIKTATLEIRNNISMKYYIIAVSVIFRIHSFLFIMIKNCYYVIVMLALTGAEISYLFYDNSRSSVCVTVWVCVCVVPNEKYHVLIWMTCQLTLRQIFYYYYLFIYAPRHTTFFHGPESSSRGKNHFLFFISLYFYIYNKMSVVVYCTNE